MNFVVLGIRNAFRNLIRTSSIVVILGLSIGLSLTMLLARQAVDKKISSVKDSIGNTITIAPAGFSNFSQVNNALSVTQLAKVKSLPHITGVVETLTDRLTTIGSSSPFGFRSSSGQTNLTSPVKLNTNGGGGRDFRLFVSGGGSLPSNFSPPVTIIGTTSPSLLNGVSGNTATLVKGNYLNGETDNNDAMVSTSMASKNNLKVGSTFSAYSQTLRVVGIYNSGTEGGNDAIIVSLPTEERLSNQSGEVTSAVATVDSLDNLNSATNAIKSTLGSAADVTSSIQQANQAISPLNNVKNIAMISLIGAIIAGSIIIFLVMVMIVRERRKEIGVLKAIGGSNLRVMLQFMVEAVTLTILGALIGVVVGILAGNPVTNTLVSSSSNSSTQSGFSRTGSGGGPVFNRPRGGFLSRNINGLHNVLTNIHANIGWSILLYGLAAAVVIALIGSSLASILISRVRPAEVMRTE